MNITKPLNTCSKALPSLLCTLVVIMLLGTSFAYADTGYKGGGVLVNKETSSRILSKEEVQRLAPLENTLGIPDTSRIMPDMEEGPYSPGVMTDEGILEDFDSRAFGSFGIPYTTTRVQTGTRSAAGVTDANLLSVTYPYNTVGKLTFSAGSCSASVIKRGIIVTAAHCVQRFGSGSASYTNFQFIPGHYGAVGATAAQSAPYGTWTWAALIRPVRWMNGTDPGSGSARTNDLALIALRKDSSGRFIADRTGRMSYGWNNYSFESSPKTGNLRTAAVSTLGYPDLMDLGRIMQRTDGPTYTTTVGGAPQLWQGSNFTTGSSGGPWVVNFRGRDAALSGGAVAGTASVMAVVGVTSWGSSNPNGIKDNYSSQFGQNSVYPNASYGTYGAGNIGYLLNTLCNSAAPGGGTYASQGYCQ